MRRAALSLAALVLAVRFPAAGEVTPVPFDAETLIRKVIQAQRLSEQGMAAYTFDQREVRTEYGKGGVATDVKWRLFHWYSGDAPGEGSRELVLVDGRPPTEGEKEKIAAEDEKDRKRRLERRAAERVANPPKVQGGDDDPLVGRRRLSDLIGKFDYTVVGEEVVDGRPTYVVDFRPRLGPPAAALAERALESLSGRVLIDAADFQIRRVVARIVRPVKIGGGLAANVKDAVLVYEGRPQMAGRWFPCVVDVRLKGRKALLFRLDVGFRAELSGFRTFRVETVSDTHAAPPAPVESPR